LEKNGDPPIKISRRRDCVTRDRTGYADPPI